MNREENSFGTVIKQARLARGMTQAKLGSLLGYSAMAISHFEKGTRAIREEDLIKIKNILDLERVVPKATSTTLFRSTSMRGGPSAQERSIQAFDKFLSEKYGTNANQ